MQKNMVHLTLAKTNFHKSVDWINKSIIWRHWDLRQVLRLKYCLNYMVILLY